MKEKIVKLISSGNPDDIYIGMHMLLRKHNNSSEFTMEVSHIYNSIENNGDAEVLMRIGWHQFYINNKQYATT